jgi:hypothetical protein
MDFVSNNKNYDSNLTQKSQSMDLFKFELNRSQSIIVLIFALTGLFLTPVLLGGETFINLFNNLFRSLPSYLSDPEHYVNLYLFYNFAPNIGNLIISSLFFYMSFMATRKILRGLGGEGTQKSKIIPQDSIVRWFGLRLTHGQAIFIFSLSLLGIPFLTLKLIVTSINIAWSNFPLFDIFYEVLLYIPTGPNRFTSLIILLNYVPLILNGIFLILCLYSIFATRRRKISQSKKVKTANNFSLLIFIISLLIFLLYLVRLFAHLFMFTDLAHLIGIPKESTNIYQFNDFLTVIFILIGALSFLVFSYFLKKRTKKVQKDKAFLMWFHIKMTKNKFLMLLAYTIMYSCIFGFSFAILFFTFGSPFIYIEIVSIYFIAFLIILYSMIKINNRKMFHRILNQFNDSDDFKTKWINFNLNRLQSVIIGSISSGAMFFYVFNMITYRTVYTNLTYFDMFFFVQVILYLTFLSILLIFTLYTIKCTYKAVKSQ